MKSAGKARNNGLYRHIRTSKEIIRNLLNDSDKSKAIITSKIPVYTSVNVIIMENWHNSKTISMLKTEPDTVRRSA